MAPHTFKQYGKLLLNGIALYFGLKKSEQGKSIETMVKGIALIMLLFAVYEMYDIYQGFSIDRLPPEGLDYRQVSLWVIYVLIPLGAGILLWKNNQIGWILSFSFLIHRLISTGTMIVLRKNMNAYLNETDFLLEIGFSLVLLLLLYLLLHVYTRKLVTLKWLPGVVIIPVVLMYSIYMNVGLYNYMQSNY